MKEKKQKKRAEASLNSQKKRTKASLNSRNKKYRLPLTVSKKKSGDSRGIRAEDIKECDDETKKMVREIFNEVITRESITPET